ncbi:MAG TPA: hypothetical protein VM470_02875 [Acidimicrobiia bacterium]|nr:hypothetical protein [Acidimicrobiia bacterium]
MAWLFVRLKARLIRNRLRKAGAWATLGFIGIWLGSFFLGATFGLFSGAVTGVVGGDATSALFTIAALVWVAGPIAAAALDETIEPRRLELLPITPRHMAVGILAASFLGPGALATVLFTVGAVIGSSPGWEAALPVLAAALLYVVWCMASARWATTLLTDLLRTRRGRDVAVLGASLLGAGAAFSSTILTGGGDPLPALAGLGAVLAYLPPGALGKSLSLLADGDWRLGLLLAVYGLAAVTAVIWGWQWSLTRLATRAPSSSASGRAAGADHPLIPRSLRKHSGVVAGVIGKELRYLRRDPRFRSQAIGLAVALAVVGFGLGRILIGTEYAPFLAVIVAWMAATSTGFNQFGLDDRSFWAYLVTGVDMRMVLKGKNLSVAVLGAPAVVGLALIAALLAGDFGNVPAALLAGGGLLAVWLGVGNVASILGPYPLPESNLFGNRNVSGGIFFATLGGLATAGVLTVPLTFLVVAPLLLWGQWAGLAGAVLAAVVGSVIYRLSLKVAGGLLESRSLRLLDILDRPPV